MRNTSGFYTTMISWVEGVRTPLKVEAVAEVEVPVQKARSSRHTGKQPKIGEVHLYLTVCGRANHFDAKSHLPSPL